MKIWKMGCQRKLAGHNQWHMATYKFICEIESAAYDFTKSILADAESLKFKPSIIVACVISTTIEIFLNLKLQQKSAEGLPSMSHLKLCNAVWDSIVKKLFGRYSLEYLDQFGRYLIMRQQNIYNTFQDKQRPHVSQLRNVYKDRCRPFYNHSFFDHILKGKAAVSTSYTPYTYSQHSGSTDDYQRRIEEE